VIDRRTVSKPSPAPRDAAPPPLLQAAMGHRLSFSEIPRIVEVLGILRLIRRDNHYQAVERPRNCQHSKDGPTSVSRHTRNAHTQSRALADLMQVNAAKFICSDK